MKNQKIWACLRPLNGLLITTVLFNVIIVSLNIGNSYVFERLIDSVLHGKPAIWVSMILLTIVLITRGMQIGYERLIFHLSSGFTKELKHSMISVISMGKLKDIDRHGSGEFISRLNVEVDEVSNFMSNQLPNALFQPLMFLAASIYMLTIDWRIYFLCYAIMPLFLVGIHQFSKKSAQYSKQYYDNLADTNSMILDSIQNIETVKAYSMIDYFLRKFDRRFENTVKLAFSSEKMDSCQLPLYFLIEEYPRIICLIVGGILAINNQISLSQLLVYIQLLGFVNQPLLTLSNIFGSIRRFFVQLKTVASLLELPQERYHFVAPEKHEDAALSVDFQNVSFKYREEAVQDQYILKGIRFKVNKGEKIALLGDSGAGKSTLFSLICGLYEAEEGHIRINGVDPRNSNVHELRSQVTYISQKPFLFSGTIRENLLFGRSDVTDAEMIKAAQIAQIDSFIQTLAKGYDTQIEENGRNLSGGQQLRLGIARALIHPAKIILLDEPTSALDHANEFHIIDNIFQCFEGSTIIISSHRFSTVRNVDRIIYLSGRTIAEQGSHDELMNLKGQYYKFVISNHFSDSEV